MALRYPLAALLMLRQRRYDDALKQRQQRQQALRAAVQAVETKKGELADYKVWKREEIDRRYDALLEQVLTQTELARFHQGIGALDIKEHALEEELRAGEQRLKQAQADLEAAKSEAVSRQKAAAKLEQHRSLFMAKAAAEAERREESELEDFTVRKEEF